VRATILVTLVFSTASLGGGEASARAANTVHAARICRGALTLPTHSNHTLIDAAITCLVDRERTVHRLPALRANHELQGIASSLAGEMALAGYFGDDTLSGRTPWQRIASSPYAVGAHVLSAAQNIGWGTGGLATPLGVVAEWMQSPPHRQIILTGGYRDVGAGVAPVAPSSVTHEKPGATYTLELAARAG
jgi:uncharacterized protein YkwD